MKTPPHKRRETASSTLAPTLWLVLAWSGLFALTAYAAAPSWWTTRTLGSPPAIVPPQVVTNNGVVTTNYIRNDYIVLSQGQVKRFAVRAVDEINARVPAGAGTNLNLMVSNWAQDYRTHGYGPNHIKPSDYRVMNVGQLKTIANLFDGRLASLGYTNLAPSWLAANPNSGTQVADLGQLREVFNFDFTLPRATQFAATATSATTVRLTWSLPAQPALGPAATWIVEERNPNLSWTFLAILPNTATSFSVTGLATGQAYHFQIFANAGNNVSPTAGVSIKL